MSSAWCTASCSSAYCVTTVLVAVDQRWSAAAYGARPGGGGAAVLHGVFDRYAERRGALGASWRLTREAPSGRVDSLVGWLLRNPLRGAAAGLVAVAALTGIALLVGPPA